MDRALDQGQLFHVKRLDTAAPEGNVDYRLVHGQNFISQRVHIHSMCEYFSRIK